MTRWTREVIEDREPVELDEGHPWRGLELRGALVMDLRGGEVRKVAWRPDVTEMLANTDGGRWASDTETGRVRWTWRPNGGVG